MSVTQESAPELLTAADLCARLEAEGRGRWEPGTVWQWTREVPPLPIAVQGKPGREHRYLLTDVLAWLDRRARRAAENADPRLEKARQEARLARLRADEMERTLVPATEVEEAIGQVIDAARTAMEGWPRRMAQLLRGVEGDSEREAVIDAEVRRVLERMARRQTVDEEVGA